MTKLTFSLLAGLDTGKLTISDPEARFVMILHELPCRSARVELQSDQPAPDPDDERFRGPGSMAGAEGATTEPVVTGLTGLAVAAGYLNN